MKVDFSENPPCVRRGFPFELTQFSGGRTGMAVAGHGGIINLLYYGSQALPGASLFQSGFPHSPWPKIFRMALKVDGRAHYPGFEQTRIFPFGFETEGRFLGVSYICQVLLLNDALVQRVRVTGNPTKRELRLKVLLHGSTRFAPPFRSWTPWAAVSDGQGITCVAHDVLPEDRLLEQISERKKNPVQNPTFENTDVAVSDTHVGLLSTCGLSMRSAGGVCEGFKTYLKTDAFVDEAAFVLCFSPEGSGLMERMRDIAITAPADCDALVESYHRRISNAPHIDVLPPSLRSCLENIPPILDSLKVPDLPGGIRAAAHGYWVWSWDGLVYPEAHLFSNDAGFVRDILRFAVRTVDSELGIPHQFNTRLSPQMAMAFPVQCLFITTLYSYYCHTGDIDTLAEAFPLANWILDKCRERIVGDTGLVQGTSLYPDFPGLLGQDGRDLSSFNNSIYYQGLVAMSHLSREMARLEGGEQCLRLAGECEALATKAKEGFHRHFYDPEAGYFYDSVSAVDLAPRKHYPVYAILWTTPFARDLLGGHTKRIASFMVKNFVRKHGLGMFPGWDSAWMCDGNQCGAYYPVVEPFFRNVMALAGRSRELKVWAKNVAWYWETNTIPEGLTYEAEDELPDNPGCKQTFAAKAWYGILFRSILGLDPGIDGLSISPGPLALPTRVTGISVRGKSLDVEVSGSGEFLRAELNGRKLCDIPITIPYEQLDTLNRLTFVYA